MYDIPQHFPIPIDEFGRGPADEADTVDVVCWCADPDCQLHKES